MKLSCNVIEDMLPMYHDKVCSEETAALVEEHIQDCAACSRILSDLRGEIAIPVSKPDDIKPLKNIQKKVKRTRMLWLIAVIVIIALIPVAFFFGNRQGEQKDNAVYSEQDALAQGNAFMTALTDGDYKTAFSYIDLKGAKREWLADPRFDEDDLPNLEADALKEFSEIGAQLEKIGGIKSYKNKEVTFFGYYNGGKMYGVSFTVEFNGKDEYFNLVVTENGIRNIAAANGLNDHPLSKIALWKKDLWDNYLGSYYDEDLGAYVFYDD